MRLFISYSQRDDTVANKISDALKTAGHTVWKWNETLKPGDNIAKKTQEGIENADIFLLIVSEHSMGSESVMREFSTLALSEISKRELKIIPVLIDQSSVPSYLLTYLYLDISKDIDAGIEKLVDSLAQQSRPAAAPPRPGAAAQTTTASVSELAAALNSGRLTLVCGAGTSVGAGVPIWNDLLLALLESMIERLSKEHSLDITTAAAGSFQERYGTSSLILGKYLKNTLGKDFPRTTRDALYSRSSRSSALLDAIVDLARPRREGKALDSIITFNFDALIEENLTAAKVPNVSIFTESVKHEPNELPVYHVHGFLPRKGKIPDSSEVVFSEDAYHGQFLDPFSWSNLIQLTKYTQNTCLFVGVSLTDPNLRRLLDVSSRKSTDKARNHYILKKLPDLGGDDKLDSLARLLEEQDANVLGINVLWFRTYEEMPALMASISGAQ
jgi:hypothetical protein